MHPPTRQHLPHTSCQTRAAFTAALYYPACRLCACIVPPVPSAAYCVGLLATCPSVTVAIVSRLDDLTFTTLTLNPSPLACTHPPRFAPTAKRSSTFHDRIAIFQSTMHTIYAAFTFVPPQLTDSPRAYVALQTLETGECSSPCTPSQSHLAMHTTDSLCTALDLPFHHPGACPHTTSNPLLLKSSHNLLLSDQIFADLYVPRPFLTDTGSSQLPRWQRRSTIGRCPTATAPTVPDVSMPLAHHSSISVFLSSVQPTSFGPPSFAHRHLNFCAYHVQCSPFLGSRSSPVCLNTRGVCGFPCYFCRTPCVLTPFPRLCYVSLYLTILLLHTPAS
jgi:hypothetical protein